MIVLNNEHSYNIENCNILKNFQESSDNGVIDIWIQGQLTLNGCLILGDLGKGKIFYIPFDGQVIVKKSFYDNLTVYDNKPITSNQNNIKTSKYNNLYIVFGIIIQVWFIENSWFMW